MPERFDENFRSGLLHCNSLLGTPVLSVLAEYFHDLVFADKFEFLNSLHFHFFFGRKVMPVLEFCEFFFEMFMVFIVFFKIRIYIQIGDYQLLIYAVHRAAYMLSYAVS